MSREGILVVGAGGHARVLVATLEAAGLTVARVVDDRPETWGSTLGGAEVTGPLASVLAGATGPAILAIGSNATRARLATAYRLAWITLVHPAAYVEPSARLGAGTVVLPGAVILTAASVGAHVIVNTGATVDHDCRIHDYAHLGPGAHLCGEVEIGAGALLGVGSCVVPKCRIGAWAQVGAGAAVVRDVPAGTTVVGVPARPLTE